MVNIMSLNPKVEGLDLFWGSFSGFWSVWGLWQAIVLRLKKKRKSDPIRSFEKSNFHCSHKEPQHKNIIHRSIPADSPKMMFISTFNLSLQHHQYFQFFYTFYNNFSKIAVCVTVDGKDNPEEKDESVHMKVYQKKYLEQMTKD